MIALHGQEKWDRAMAQTAEIAAAGGTTEARQLTPEEIAAARAERLGDGRAHRQRASPRSSSCSR
jgi:hypothetical protein